MANHEIQNSMTEKFIEQLGLRHSRERDPIDRIKDIVKIKKLEVEWEVDWKKFKELEESREGTYNDQLHVTAINLLEKVGVLSMNPENNYELLHKGIPGGLDGPGYSGISFYFTREDDAKTYAEAKWGKGHTSIIHIPKGTKINL